VRSRYIVSYDICEPERLRRVYKTMRGFGDHLQYSVFRCDLSDVQRVEMVGMLGAIINFADDQVLIIDIGPAVGRGATCISAIGRPYTNPERHAVVI
jgi:CRISPR-associated protein Cas2